MCVYTQTTTAQGNGRAVESAATEHQQHACSTTTTREATTARKARETATDTTTSTVKVSTNNFAIDLTQSTTTLEAQVAIGSGAIHSLSNRSRATSRAQLEIYLAAITAIDNSNNNTFYYENCYYYFFLYTSKLFSISIGFVLYSDRNDIIRRLNAIQNTGSVQDSQELLGEVHGGLTENASSIIKLLNRAQLAMNLLFHSSFSTAPTSVHHQPPQPTFSAGDAIKKKR